MFYLFLKQCFFGVRIVRLQNKLKLDASEKNQGLESQSIPAIALVDFPIWHLNIEKMTFMVYAKL